MADKTTSKTSKSTPSPQEMADVEKLLAEETDKVDQAEKEAAAEAAKARAEKPKKKKGKKEQKPSLFARTGQGIVNAQSQFVELFRGLVSPDRPTRRMSFFFFVSLAGLVSVGILTVQRRVALEHEREAREAALRQEELERQKEAALLGNTEVVEEDLNALSMLNLGQFTLELKPIPGRLKTGGFMDMAEVELVVECDSKATHDYIETNLVQARNQITDILTTIDREELLSRDGKRKLKKRLLERLNGWIPSGHIQAIFFSKLVVA